MDPLFSPQIPLVPCSNHYPSLLGFPCGLAGKESPCNVGDLDSIPGLGRSPGEGKGYLLQYSCLENSMDKESDMTERLSLHFTSYSNIK